MSERIKVRSQLPNEEVVEQLTKDWKSSLSVENQSKDSEMKSSDELPSPTEDTLPTIKPKNNVPNEDNPTVKDFDDEGNECSEESCDDSGDEAAFKDSELTEDQKAERQIIAEELKNSGNQAYKNENYELSMEKYTEGLKICPLENKQQRAVLYCNRAAAKMKLDRHSKAIKDCTKALKLDENYLKAYVRRAQCYENTQKFEESLTDYKKILELHPGHKEATKAILRLPPLIEEKNEKLKAEMMAKLKDLGNMVLKPFGLSTDNFKLDPDPDTKGYKINFVQ